MYAVCLERRIRLVAILPFPTSQLKEEHCNWMKLDFVRELESNLKES